jgi:hypothetical protein
MAKTDFKSVDQYISTFPEDVQGILQRLRLRSLQRSSPAGQSRRRPDDYAERK